MAKRDRLLLALIVLATLAAASLLGGRAVAESCQATQTAVTMDAQATKATPTPAPAPVADGSVAPSSAPAAPLQATAINTQDINLEKSFMQDGDSERAHYATRDGDPTGKEIFISATVDPLTGDATLIIRDLRTGLSANAAGAFGNDGVIATSLSGIINGIQKLITLTCQK